MIKIFKSILLITLLFGFLWGLLLEPCPIKAGDEGVTLQTTVESYLSVSVDSSTVNMGNLQTGTPVTGNTTITTTTNNNSGYQVQVKRDNADYTLKKDSYYIADKTSWDPTTNSGDGNAVVWSGTGLAFRLVQTGTTATYNSTWWGSDDTSSNAKFAGFPSSSTQTMNHTTYSETSTVTKIGYKIDVPSSQSTGAYSGGITFSVVAN